ncbi:hypothetical protein NE237_010896 [Protea cynaroides]|uniref:Uncharacterized protein n=1 Tax=Protea cynaroides TaxID=273540 RepID=A0A9Q0L149_9MAGN|nr:hypothetical protein NE237_010896 [Protea cynaroides]
MYQTEAAPVDIQVFDTFQSSISGIRRLKLESDGNLRDYYNWFDLKRVSNFQATGDKCKLPNACGSYGLYIPGGDCSCLDNQTEYTGHRKGEKPWKETAIEEEGLLDDGDTHKGLPRRCYLLAFVVGFIFLFSFFYLILWAASRPQKPQITIKFTYGNTATFFGVHVTSTPVDLSYSRLSIGSGSMHKFYQSRKNQRTVAMVVSENKILMYGGGASLSSSGGNLTAPINLKLDFMIRSRAYVLGKLVKPLFYRNIVSFTSW